MHDNCKTSQNPGTTDVIGIKVQYDCHILTFLKAKTTRQRTATMVEVPDVTVSGDSIWDGSSKTISTKKDAWMRLDVVKGISRCRSRNRRNFIVV